MKRIAIIALDGCYTSSFCDLLDVAHITNLYIANRLGEAAQEVRLHGEPARIVWQVLSIDGQQPKGAVGLPISVAPLPMAEAEERFDLVFVPALDYPSTEIFLERLKRFEPLYPWLTRQWEQGAVIASICTGTFILAEAGLLDGRAATTSWWLEKQFQRRYPAVNLNIKHEITEQDRVFCGSTLSVNLKLSLRLLERFLSSDIFNLTVKSVMSSARREVLPPGVLLPGDFDEVNVLDVDDDLVAKAQYWFQRNMSKRIRLSDVADNMLVSEKTLVRHFKKTLGITPHEYLLGIRMDSAKSMLVNGDMRIEKIAERVGYGDLSFFQQVFRKHAGVTPTVYRKQFARAPARADSEEIG